MTDGDGSDMEYWRDKGRDEAMKKVKGILRVAYIKCWECFNEASTIEKQSAFSQRMDEILLNYSNIFGFSVNESKKLLLDAENVKDEVKK